MSGPTPTVTIVTATIAGTSAAAFVARHHAGITGPYVDRDTLQDALLVFGGLIMGGVLLGGLANSNSVGRGLLWGAGSLAAAYGIDKALIRK
jgi:hypothetical protein